MLPQLWAYITEHEVPNGLPKASDPWWGDAPPTTAGIVELGRGALIFGGASVPTGHVVRCVGSYEACRAMYDSELEKDWAEWLSNWKKGLADDLTST